MKRRTYAVLGFGTVTALVALAAIQPLTTGGVINVNYVFIAIVFGLLTGYYQFHPSPMDDPDEPVPDWWFRLTTYGAIAAAVVAGGAVLFTVL